MSQTIQSRLREQFRAMRLLGITTGDIPFRVVTYGESKEYETWISAVKIIRKELDSVVDVDTDVKAEQFKTELTPQQINDIITPYRI